MLHCISVLKVCIESKRRKTSLKYYFDLGLLSKSIYKNVKSVKTYKNKKIVQKCFTSMPETFTSDEYGTD